jgi:hypothetical protein
MAAAVSETPKKRRVGDGTPGPGRPKGSKDKLPQELKAMILQALDKSGGVDYLVSRAKDPRTASAFLTLIGKVLPMQVTGPGGGPVQIARIELVPMTDDSRKG